MATAKKSTARTGGKSGSSARAGMPRSKAARSGAAKSRSTKSASSGRQSSAKSSGRSGTKSARSQTKARSSRSSETTIDHDEIKQWVESRGGRPATVAGTERGSETAGLLRIDFPGYAGEQSLSPLDWEEFFEKFEDAELAFLYDTDKKSKFNKFVARGKKRF